MSQKIDNLSTKDKRESPDIDTSQLEYSTVHSTGIHLRYVLCKCSGTIIIIQNQRDLIKNCINWATNLTSFNP